MAASYLDLRTLTVLIAVESAFICLPLMYFVRVQKVFPGIATWAAASLSGFVGLILTALQGFVPDVFGVIVANVLTLGANLLVMRGLKSFVGNPQKDWADIAILVALAGSLMVFLRAWPSLNARIFAFSELLALVTARSFLIVLRGFPRIMGRGNALLSGCFGVVTIWFMLRGFLVLIVREQATTFMSSGILQGVTLLVAFASILILMAGLLIASSQRLQRELGAALNQVNTLSGLLPICSHCKQIRDNDGQWMPIETYVGKRSEATFSHTICPDCMQKYYPDLAT